jgi:hypothetical protein
MLPCPLSLERVKPVAWRDLEIIKPSRQVDVLQLPSCSLDHIRRKPSRLASRVQPLRVPIRERLDHVVMCTLSRDACQGAQSTARFGRGSSIRAIPPHMRSKAPARGRCTGLGSVSTAFAGGLDEVRADPGRSQRERPRYRSLRRVHRLSKSSGRSSGTSTEHDLDAGCDGGVQRSVESPRPFAGCRALPSGGLWTDKLYLNSMTHCLGSSRPPTRVLGARFAAHSPWIASFSHGERSVPQRSRDVPQGECEIGLNMHCMMGIP